MFHLADIRETRSWQEAREEGVEVGLEKGLEKGREEGRQEGKLATIKEMVHNCLEKGLSPKEIADLLKIPLTEVRRLAKQH